MKTLTRGLCKHTWRQIYFVRHGETPSNPLNILQGSSRPELSLSPRGVIQAQRLGRYLSDTAFDEVWTSDYSRALQTAHLVTTESKLPRKPRVDTRLRERDYGDAEEKPLFDFLGEAKRRGIEHFFHQPPNAESYDDMMHRVDSIFTEIWNGEGRLLFVTHGGFLLFLNKYLTTHPHIHVENFHASRGFEMSENTGVTRFNLTTPNPSANDSSSLNESLKRSRVIYEAVSDTTHLD